MVFRRVVDAYQLQGLSLREALRKYDAIDYGTGKIFAGDKYWQVPVERRIWATARPTRDTAFASELPVP